MQNFDPCCVTLPPPFPANLSSTKKTYGEFAVSLLTHISFDEVVAAFVTCLVIRELMIFSLPDRIAGPGGWLIDTGSEEA